MALSTACYDDCCESSQCFLSLGHEACSDFKPITSKVNEQSLPACFAGFEFLSVIAAAAQSLRIPSACPSEDFASLSRSLDSCLEAVSSSARMQRLCILREGDRCPEEAEVGCPHCFIHKPSMCLDLIPV